MYQKRSAWILTGVAPNRGPETDLSDIEPAIISGSSPGAGAFGFLRHGLTQIDTDQIRVNLR